MSEGRQETEARPWLALTPERIRAARRALGLKQDDFALYLGRRRRLGTRPRQQHVSRWEKGVRAPGDYWGPTLLRIVQETEATRRNLGATEQTATAPERT